MARTLFPQAEVVVVPDYDALLRDDSIDAALWTLEQARAWAAANPGFSAVAPTIWPCRAFYRLPDVTGFSLSLQIFANEWLDLQRMNGSEQRMKEIPARRQL